MLKSKKSKDAVRIIIAIVLLLNLPVTKKMSYDKDMAKYLLEDTYRPMISFVDSLEATDDLHKLKVPADITTYEDYLQALNLPEGEVDDLYEDWITDENGQLYADGNLYVPTIYGPYAEIEKAYIKVEQRLINKLTFWTDENVKTALIIKVKSKCYESAYVHQTYRFSQEADGGFALKHLTGTTQYGYTDPTSNPWSEMW